MYEFTEDCMIHVEEIDNEHRRLFQMINEAVELVSNTEDVQAIASSLIKNLKDYAATHFAHEEAYMERLNDPELAVQKKEHAAFTQKVNAFEPDASSPQALKASVQELLEYLVHWLYHHILSSDIMIGKIPAASEQTEDQFAFTDKYKTGITLVDDEHRRLFEIIKDTNDVIHAELLHDKYDEIMRLLGELREYTEVHFSDEEQLMERINYPGLDAQKRAHSAFVARLVEIDLAELDAMDDNQQEYLMDLIGFLLGWLSNHILGMDKQIGTYMKEQGLEE